MQRSQGYILRTRPYSDANEIVDVLTETVGRMTFIARPAKLRGKVQKGHLQPFRLLHLDWSGRGELLRLTQTDERFRHRIPVANLVYGMYLNELVLRLTPQHHVVESLYTDYHSALRLLSESDAPMLVLLRFEVRLMAHLGHALNVWQDDQTGEAINPSQRYSYHAGAGLVPYFGESQMTGTLIRGDLLEAMREPTSMSLYHCEQLRLFLDKFWLQIHSKPFNSRKLLSF